MRTILTLLFCLTFVISLAQEQPEYLPKGHLFEPILLDPIEAQSYAAVGRALNKSFISSGLYLPFSIGFQKGLVRWEGAKRRKKEIVLDLTSFTQFEVFYSQSEKKLKRHLLNTDYKVSISWQGQVNAEQSFRLRFYHISSHLGDDYLLKNGYTSFYRNPVNYEHTDFTYSWQKAHWRYYAGAGVGIRPIQERKRLAFQGGVLFRTPVIGKKDLKWIVGVDMRSLQQTDFEPGIKISFGVQVGKEERNPFNFLFEYYNGHLPYSKFEDQHVQWLAAGFYFNPF